MMLSCQETRPLKCGLSGGFFLAFNGSCVVNHNEAVWQANPHSCLHWLIQTRHHLLYSIVSCYLVWVWRLFKSLTGLRLLEVMIHYCSKYEVCEVCNRAVVGC